MNITTEQLEEKAGCERFRDEFYQLAYKKCRIMCDALIDAGGNTSNEKFTDAAFYFYDKFEKLVEQACRDDATAVTIGNQCDDAAEKRAQLMDAPWNLERAA
jgi:hypothetical protein